MRRRWTQRCGTERGARALFIYIFFRSFMLISFQPTFLFRQQRSHRRRVRGGCFPKRTRRRQEEDFSERPLKRKARRRGVPKRDERFALRSARTETTTKGPGQFLVARLRTAAPRLQDCCYGASQPLQAVRGARLCETLPEVLKVGLISRKLFYCAGDSLGGYHVCLYTRKHSTTQGEPARHDRTGSNV